MPIHASDEGYPSHHSHPAAELGRRRFLRNTGLFSLAIVGGASAEGIRGQSAAAASVTDYATQAAYDACYKDLVYSVVTDNDGGYIAWNNGYILKSYMTMYHAFGDLKYLHDLVGDFNSILNYRDSERGVTDYLGRSLPTWRTGYGNATGTVDVVDASNKKLFTLRIGLYGSTTTHGTAVVKAGSAAGLFTITSTNHNGTSQDVYADLSLDAGSPNYVVTRLHNANPSVTKTTAVDLRTPGVTYGQPSFKTYNYKSEWLTVPIDLGMILTPIADFVATVYSTPALQARFGAKADEYLDAVLGALTALDGRWQQNSAGEEWYQSDPNGVTALSGADLPHNQNLAMASVYIHLFKATGNTAYSDRAGRLLTRFRNALNHEAARDLYTWTYFDEDGLGYTGWTHEQNISSRIRYSNGYTAWEDIGHALVELEAAILGQQNGIVFTTADLTRLGNTFIHKIALQVTVECPPAPNRVQKTRFYVNGGTKCAAWADTIVGGWTQLAPWKPEVFTFARDLYNSQTVAIHPLHIYTIACLAAAGA